MLENKKFIITNENTPFYVQKIAKWIKTKVHDTHQTGVVLGMSGGVDCCVVARLCQIADIPVHLVLMPYGNSLTNSSSTMEFISKFGFEYHIHDIRPSIDSALIPDGSSLLEGCIPKDIALARANLRPRERTKYLYQYAGLHKRLVIGTTNLSEYMLGYFTKWGDMADINPLLLLTKKEVYVLAKFLQLPNSIIEKAPSAELWEGQTDEDELGLTYTQIDKYILNGNSESLEIDNLIKRKILLSEHKRKKTPFFYE